MIKQPIDLDFSGKKFSMILYGSPGLGKTTLALSAPKPVLIDFDRGISRVKAYHRRLTIVCDTYEEVLSDIQSAEIADCETIVIDTGGSFVNYLQDWAVRTNPTVNAQKNGTISLKGFGAVKQEFQRFTNYVKDTLNKNLIYVFHSDEQKDKEGNPTQRLICEGAARNLVWQPCDIGGYMQMVGKERTIAFTPTDEYFAKGTYGISGVRKIPTLEAADANDFLTKLFDEARRNIAAENDIFAPQKKAYDAVMEKAGKIIKQVKDAASANAAIEKLKALEHALSSQKESAAALNEKAKSLGLSYDKESKGYK